MTSAPRYDPRPHSLVAGIGNVLRCDDGFGPAVVRALEASPALPPGVRLIEVGIGGMGLVLELLDSYERLVIVDAVDRGGPPGSLYMLEPQVPELAALVEQQTHDACLSCLGPGDDMHQIGPGKALIMARALGVLPPFIRLVGCQPGETEEFSLELSQPVQQSVPAAVQMILNLIGSHSPCQAVA